MTDRSTEDWRSLSEYLDRALDLDEAQLERWLDELRGRDPKTAARLAEALALRGQCDFAAFLSEPVRLADAADAVAPALVGRHVGPYVIDAEIGRGGMGSVWRAHRADGRYEGVVAVKFVHATWMGRAGEQRFRIEGSLLGRLDHPHIARLLDAGVVDGSQPYLILEHVEGEPIDVYCARHALDAEARMRLFLEVLDAVAHAHSHLVVHRDLKPTNILVTRQGSVKLLDFGIAKLLDPATDEGVQTRSSAAALTPQYAAPEQLLGRNITTATDVYAMGLVLYLLLTGSHPLRAGSLSSAELLHEVVTQVPPRASSVAALADIPGRMLEGDLDNILHKALKKEPDERYSTARSFAEDIQRYLSHQPVQARADTARYRMTKFVRRHRGGVSAGALTVLAIAIGIIGTISQARRAEEQAQRAQHERDAALRQLSYAEAANEFVNFLLGDGSGKSRTTIELLERADQLVDKQFAADAALRARLQLMIGGSYSLAADLDKAAAILRRARASVETAGDPALRAIIDCTLGNVEFEAGNGAAAMQLLSSAIARLRSAPEPDAGAMAACLTMRGEQEALEGNGKAALASGMEALRWLGVPRPGQRTLAMAAHCAVAEGYGRLGDLPASIREYETAMREFAAMGRDRTADASVTMNNLAEKYSRAGQFVEAAAHYERSLEIATEVEGAEGVNPLTEANYAASLFDNGRSREALSHFEHAFVASRRRNQVLWAAYIQTMAAPALCDAGELVRCAQWIAEARDAARKSLPDTHGIFAVLELDSARLDVARGGLADARARLQHAGQMFAASPDAHPSSILALELLARCDERLGDHAAALRVAEQALAAAQGMRTGFRHTAWIGSALLAKAVIQAADGAATARPTLQDAVAHLDDAAGPDAPATREAHALLARIDAASDGAH